MKAVALLLLRLVTGLYLLAWSVVKLTSTDRAVEISNKLYFGLFSNPVVQHGLGALGGVLGLFVILGFLRSFSYLVQALVLALGVGVLAKTMTAPVDFASGVDLTTALTPYLALFVAAVVPLLAKLDDVLSLDVFLAWAERRLGRDELAAPVVTAAAVAAAAAAADEVAQYDEPAYEEPAQEDAVVEAAAPEDAYAAPAVDEVAVDAPLIEEAAAEDVAVEAPPAEESVMEAQAGPVPLEVAVDEAPAVEVQAVEEATPEAAGEAEPALEELAAVEAQKHEAPAPTVH
ncbi:hypothetical protein F2P47_15245 [Parvibaculum sedimenti]|uniref:DoxX family membrane protein n=1 Tax=Parvibaculum sedimenti TaxID=2608632 RepID=A0A6N6VFX6_9HYPH|nr:hypothetical protein [Parvibaculum sedimenti]KAB7738794.1 hypothetical protein F2P47_15245 [Parvibaculum sedimenti]